MKTFFLTLGALAAIFFVVCVMVCLSWIGTYNVLNSGSQVVQEKAADVDSTLQRRYDLIPNVVNTVKGYASHESGVLVAVTEARAKVGQIKISDAATNPEAMKKFAEAQGDLSSALSRLLIVQEKYPDLKANEGFRDLQSQLEGTENRINEARQRYNKAVKEYNTHVGAFFGRFVANMHGFKRAESFAVADAAKQAPKVAF